MVRTLRCGRNNPGSNPGHGSIVYWLFVIIFYVLFRNVIRYKQFEFGFHEKTVSLSLTTNKNLEKVRPAKVVQSQSVGFEPTLQDGI